MSRFFLRTLVTLALVASIFSISRAQDENIIRPNTKSGSAAWVFTVGGLGTFGLNGQTLASITVPGTSDAKAQEVYGAGYKYYLSDDLALRALLGFSSYSDGDASTSTGSNTNTMWGIAAGIEMHTHAVYSTSPYFGAQIGYASASTDNKSTEVTGGTSVENKGSASVFSIGVLAGFDWYFTRGIAVGGEYMLGFSSTSSSVTSGSTTTNNPSATLIGINASNLDVHLVVHF